MTRNDKYIFIMFSSTPFKMGRFIRTVTNNRFNHVSLCLDVEGVTLYSFARKYKNHPFYGGFVKESSARFVHNNQFADIKLCAIPVTNHQYSIVKELMTKMENNAHTYVYNHFSAIGTIVKKRVSVENAFTCVEFVTNILSKIGIVPCDKEHEICAIKDMEKLLAEYVIYEGTFEHMALQINDQHDMFYTYNNVYVGTLQAFYANSKLIYSFIKGNTWI